MTLNEHGDITKFDLEVRDLMQKLLKIVQDTDYSHPVSAIAAAIVAAIESEAVRRNFSKEMLEAVNVAAQAYCQSAIDLCFVDEAEQ